MFITRVRPTRLNLAKRAALSAAKRFGWMSMPESLSLIQLWMRRSPPLNRFGLRLDCRLELSSRRAEAFMSIGSAKTLGVPKNGFVGQAVLKAYAASMASTLTQQERLTPLRSCVLQARTTGKTDWRRAKFDFYPLAGSILVHSTRPSSLIALSASRAR